MTNYLEADLHEETPEACLPDRPAQTDPRLLDAAVAQLDPIERLRLLAQRIGGTLVFTTSFGLEDQALTHLIAESRVTVRYVTLDTGRLFPETYGVWSATEQRYGIRIHGYYPNAAALETLVDAQGIDGFYASQTARKSCCDVRKVEPLRRALRGAAGWITGLRADQSTWRRDMSFVAYDPAYGVLKANPLLDWSRDRVAAPWSPRNGSLIAHCTNVDSCRSVARRARALCVPASPNVRDAGGGRRKSRKNAACISPPTVASCARAPPRERRYHASAAAGSREHLHFSGGHCHQ